MSDKIKLVRTSQIMTVAVHSLYTVYHRAKRGVCESSLLPAVIMLLLYCFIQLLFVGNPAKNFTFLERSKNVAPMFAERF